MKWGILATGNIAKKFASTINQMSKSNFILFTVTTIMQKIDIQFLT